MTNESPVEGRVSQNPMEKWVVPLSSEQERVAIETLLAQVPFQPEKQVEILKQAIRETERCMQRFFQEDNMLASNYFNKWRQNLEKKLETLQKEQLSIQQNTQTPPVL